MNNTNITVALPEDARKARANQVLISSRLDQNSEKYQDCLDRIAKIDGELRITFHMSCSITVLTSLSLCGGTHYGNQESNRKHVASENEGDDPS